MADTVLSVLSGSWLQILSTMLVAYLLGSISFSIIITKKVAQNADIRKMGSGNAGFTNVLRSVGKGPAVFTIVFDFLKGVLAVALGGLIFSTIVQNAAPAEELVSYGKYIAGFCCILGHMFPVYFGFKGGKGIVTAAALMLVADWRVFLAVIAVFLIVFLITKIISEASLVSAVFYPIFTFCFTYFLDYLPSLETAQPRTILYVIFGTAFSFGVGLVVFIKHRENIKRIINGTEKKITAKSKKEN